MIAVRRAQAARMRGLRVPRGFLFVAPYLPFLIGFGILPMLYALYLAVTNDSGGWVGIDNFIHTVRDYRFVPAFGHIILYTCVWLGSLIVIVVGLALLLHGRANRTSSTFRFLFYIPGALAGASSVLVWLFMLDPVVSPGSFLLHHLLGSELFVESIAPGKLPFVFAMIAFWTGAGGWILVLYGALNTIPADVLEAATVDGAGPVRTAWRVQLPMIGKWITYMLILSLAAGTQLFVEPQLLSQSSFGVVSNYYSANQLAYQYAFNQNNFNGAAAISIDLLVVALICATVLIARGRLFKTD